MRFIVVADRFSAEHQDRLNQLNCQTAPKRKRDAKSARKQAPVKDRSVDEIKARYFSVSKEILKLRGETKHPIVVKPFNYEMEVRRKNNLEKIFMRTKDMIEQEKYYLQQLKRID
jgi:hypothetical protein